MEPAPAGSAPAAESPEIQQQGSEVGHSTAEAQSSTPETLGRITTNEAVPEVEKTQAEPSELAVELVLKFVAGRTTTYKITTELQKSVVWKGTPAAKPAQFTDGRTGNHVELTFEQKVQQVQDDGTAVLAITIERLKYVGEVVNKTVFDFDSARPEDSASPLAVLIGKSYQVKVSASGKVLEIDNVEPLRRALQGGLPAQTVARRLLSENEIRDRHEITALSALKDRQVRPGQSWSSLRTFSFDNLGAKTYERVYTLQPVQQGPGRIAVVEMKAIPSAARAEELHERQAQNPFVGMSDNTDSYHGRLVLDLDSGQVREYTEQMQNEWIIADPTSVEKGQPAAIRMAAWRLHRLEQIR